MALNRIMLVMIAKLKRRETRSVVVIAVRGFRRGGGGARPSNPRTASSSSKHPFYNANVDLTKSIACVIIDLSLLHSQPGGHEPERHCE